ncbi:MAG: hypothetical protein ACTHLR_04555 [Rhizomicrobium sp.]
MSGPVKTAAKTDTAAPTDTKTAAGDTGSGDSFWHDLLDVVNPLQHLPVVSTIYRAVTGDKIGDVEKVAGDTLYGGPIGLVSSLADVAFEKITGKDFGDTVMAFVGIGGHDDNNTALAANTPKSTPDKTVAASKPLIVASAAPASLVKLPDPSPVKTETAATSQPASNAAQAAAAKSSTPVNISPDTDALLNALARNGVTGQLQAQALDAYRRTMSMNSGALVPAAN